MKFLLRVEASQIRPEFNAKFFAAKELAENSHVQDAFVIAVEQQAKERLERLSALRKIKPVDMTKLSQQVRTATFLAISGANSSTESDTPDCHLSFSSSSSR